MFNGVFANQNTSTSFGTFPIGPTPLSKTFNFKQLLAADVGKVVRTQPNKTSCATDRLSYKLVKEAGHGIVGTLTSLFDPSLWLRRIPEEWKNAVVTPIFKRGRKDGHHPANCRKIYWSLTSCIARIMEKLPNAQVLDYCNRTNTNRGFSPGTQR